VKSVWFGIGKAAFWLTWPMIWVYLRGRKRARILVVCGNQLLVTKAWLSNGQWALPGGGLHKGESSLDAVLRELYEETGLRLQPSQVQRHSEQVFHGSGLRFNYVLFVTVLKRKAALRPQPFEISDVQWLRRHDLSAANARTDVLTALDAWWPRRGRGNLLQ
jgi:8-oxo-dGTP pyrophosphatase MutT (NUDIX family)